MEFSFMAVFVEYKISDEQSLHSIALGSLIDSCPSGCVLSATPPGTNSNLKFLLRNLSQIALRSVALYPNVFQP
jgi:hypothetical protein